MSLIRVSERAFLAKGPAKTSPRQVFEVSDKKLSTEKCRNIAEAAFEQIKKNSWTTRFRIGDRCFKVVKLRNYSIRWTLIARILSIFHSNISDGKVRYQVVPAWFTFGGKPIDEKSYENEVSGRNLKAFTAIGTLAFQTFESHFSAKDNFKLEDSNYRVVLTVGGLQLLQKDDPEAKDKGALNLFKNLMKNHLGDDKFNELTGLYGIDWENCDGLTPEHIYRMNIGTLDRSDCVATKEERKEAYTGRKVRQPMDGVYSTADLGTYKAYEDQRELAQVFSELMKAKTLKDYHEILAHVVARKHLARRTPGGYKVGALIPSPKFDEDGKAISGSSDTYRVTSCISNGYSYLYTLEAKEKDSTLPTIVLCRNTPTNYSSMYAGGAVWNDFNYFNSPGRLALNKLMVPFFEFLRARTVPLWVGYLELAKRTLGVEQKKALKGAIDALEAEEKKKATPLTMKEILQKYDLFLLLQMRRYEESHFGVFGSDYKTLRGWIQKYLIENKPHDGEDIEKMIDWLNRLEESSSLKTDLLTDLKFKGSPLPEIIRNCRMASNPNAIMTLLKREALIRNETISSKKACDLQFVGHSLGGALAATLAATLATTGRMLLPMKNLQIACFDDPKTNEDDNTAFKSWVIKHHQLFLGLKSEKIRMTRIYEASDFLPLGGEEHLGAAFSSKEEDDLRNGLEFSGKVLTRWQGLSKYVRAAYMVHATRFGMGRPWRPSDSANPDYSESGFTLSQLGCFANWKKYRQESNDLNSNVEHDFLVKVKWKISSFAERFFTEERRKLPGFMTRQLTRLISLDRNKGHRPPDKDLDSHGNFVVKFT